MERKGQERGGEMTGIGGEERRGWLKIGFSYDKDKAIANMISAEKKNALLYNYYCST